MEGTAVYARQSTDKQQSVPWQVDWAKGIAADHKWSITTATEYREIGGHSDDLSIKGRPELRRALQDAKDGKFVRLMVWDRTRLARGEDLILLLDYFAKFGVKVYIGDLAADHGDNTELIVEFLRVMDKHFLKTLRKNTRRGMQAAKEAGKHIGKPPLGFAVDSGGRLVREQWAEELLGAVEDAGMRAVQGSGRFVVPRGKHKGKPLSLTGIRRVVRNLRADDVRGAVEESSAASRERYAKVKAIRDAEAHAFRMELLNRMGPKGSERASL